MFGIFGDAAWIEFVQGSSPNGRKAPEPSSVHFLGFVNNFDYGAALPHFDVAGKGKPGPGKDDSFSRRGVFRCAPLVRILAFPISRHANLRILYLAVH